MRTHRLLMFVLALGVLAAACTGGGEGAAENPGGEDAPLAAGGGTEPAGDDEEVAQAPEGGGGLQAIRDRGSIICGVNDAVPGFGFTDEEGQFAGFDIDFCRAFAAGIFGDPEAVEFRALTADQRFTALASGEIDVLVRNTTWTATRDGAEGATFLTTTFYDGQGMMVRSDSDFTSVDDLSESPVCVLQGTTTEANLARRLAGTNYEAVTFPDNDTLQQAFVEGRCDGWTSDKSQLAGVQSNFPEGPEALTILEETFSKEPLGPAVSDGNWQLAQVVDWIIHATMIAEELEITQDNVTEMVEGDDDEVRSFLGQPVGEDDAITMPGLGLEPDFAVDVITAVGNYGEIFDRNIGEGSALGLERQLNELYVNGGLHYPPPYR